MIVPTKRHRWRRRLKIWVHPADVREFVDRGTLVPVSWTRWGEEDWRRGHFALRNPARSRSPAARGNEHRVPFDMFLEALVKGGLGIYRVEGHTRESLRIGWCAWYGDFRNPRRWREGRRLSSYEAD